ncbi:carbohydrate ABC transporter membrane protein 2, CUT1 family [Sphaerochaeta associata]|jgi:raffinose/stachyose/melibiose transport system permease protein|uniref:Carbohydrate ABC transporter permease n=2 Tax=root TaxID=1 RepID=A0ABY4DAT9_9SPIR|nr:MULTISPECIES: carbohydrate ABC transporter permease [Sphaerochaeta]MDD3425086.1 carbohydrate ABC transporter permease [Sphaerochaeta sp.]MEA5030212.1 carbohydrate ABC transporter permease [Sphaerochaeta associata]UOM51393.1 carbohydrate ABC transporter permease [Sphaerochaeta associata]SMP62473.1 carbohydrate ABC transporter membrane protein 2, CUT1 family [Sphaerochaeta associata]
MKKTITLGKGLSYLLMITFTLLTIIPLTWMILSAFKPHALIVRHPLSPPVSWYIENFTLAWTQGHLGIYFINSTIYSLVATFFTVLFAMSSGYALSKFHYKSSRFVSLLYTLGLLITVHSVIVPLFIMETKLGLSNTRLGVILPYIAFGLPFQVFLATTYIKGIPDAMQESAIIDGATFIQVFLKIIIPVATPIISTMFIYTFLGNWNEFILVLTLTSDLTVRSLPVGINSFAGGMSRDYGLQFAALVIGTVPMIIFYLIFKDKIAQGFAAGALKE